MVVTNLFFHFWLYAPRMHQFLLLLEHARWRRGFYFLPDPVPTRHRFSRPTARAGVAMSVGRGFAFLVVVALSFVGGMVVNSAYLSLSVKTGDAATWFGAVGAFLAFGATIWVATSQTRQKNLEARNLAVLAAARLNPILMNYLAIWGEMDTAFKHAVEHKIEEEFDSHLHRMQAVTSWTPADIFPLVYLPNNVAYYLEHVQTVQPFQIYNFKSNLSHAATYDPVSDTNEYDWAAIGMAVTTYLAVAKESATGVQIASNECSRIIPRSPLADR